MNQFLELPPDIDSLELSEETELQQLAQNEPEATSTPVEEQQQETSANRVTFEFDLDDISGSIRRLQEANPQVANVINSMVGNKAKRQWEPRVQEAKLEAERYRRELELERLKAIPTEERNRRIATDADFANMVREIEQGPDYEAQMRNLAATRRIFSTLQDAVDRGLPEEKAEEYLTRISQGEFDKDESGNDLDFESAMSRLHSSLMDELLTSRTAGGTGDSSRPPAQLESEAQASSANAEPPPPVVRDSASPDISSGRSAAGGTTFTVQQIRNMTPDEYLMHFPNDGDYEDAIRQGRIVGLSPEAMQVYR